MGNRPPWTRRLDTDDRICRELGITQFDLSRLRKYLHTYWDRAPLLERQRLADGGTSPRFALLDRLMREAWSVLGPYERWVRYIDFAEQDIHEMCFGQYPIAPYVIRLYSALFGIRVEFLLLGNSPALADKPISIDVWPVSQTQ